jgi:tetratricopeptide (TPR) repeat protein
MADLKSLLIQFTKNLTILQEREAKYGGAAPLSLLNHIEDYHKAIALVEQALAGQLSPAELEAGLAPLNLELPPLVAIPPALALHQLPAPPADFTGREAELAELTAVLEGGGVTISGLRGLGGIGKTALALKLAERLAPRYPDAQFYLDLRGADPQPLPSTAALAHVIRAYHPTARLPEAEAELTALYRSALHGQQALLLMDNAASAAQVEPLLPPPGCALLVTSRHHFHLPGLYAKNLDTLPPDDARALLLKIAPRLLTSPPPLTTLAHLCGYLPLALRLAGSALAERPDLSPETYLRRLANTQKRLDLIEASLSLSYNLLSPELQQCWAALSIFPADFDLLAAAFVWNLDPDAADERLGDLLKYSLLDYGQGSKGTQEQGRKFLSPAPPRRGAGGEVETEAAGETEPARYKLHDLARLFTGSRLDPTARAEARQRHAAHYENLLRTAQELYKQGGDKVVLGLALFDLEWTNIKAGQDWAEAHTTADAAARLCSTYPDAGAYLLHLRQHPRERIHWLEEALAAARQLQDRSMEGAHLGNLGLAYAALGENRRAIEHYEQRLVIAHEIGDRRGEGSALMNMGNAFYNLGEYRRAVEFHEQALNVFHEIGDRRGEGNALGNLGNAYADLGESRRAIEYYEQVLVITREIGDRRGEGNALGNLGIAYYDLGESRRAIEHYEQRLVIAREIGDRRGEGHALGNLGLAYATLGENRRAIEYYEQVLAIARKIGDRRVEGNAQFNMSLALDQLGDRAQAITHAEAALQIFEQIESSYAGRVREQLAQWRGEES